MKEKICSNCCELKNVDDFHKRGNRWKSHCKLCRKKLEGEKSKIRARKYRQENIEKIRKKQRERYHKKDKTIRNDKQRRMFSQNPEKRILHNMRCRISKCVNGKSKKTKQLLGCDYFEFLQYIESLFENGMNWDNYGEWHIDHIKPCSLFDFTNESEIEECFHYTNLQPLWKIENLKKGNKF